MKDTITAKDIEDTVNRLKAVEWNPPTEADIARYIKQKQETDRIIEAGTWCVVDNAHCEPASRVSPGGGPGGRCGQIKRGGCGLKIPREDPSAVSKNGRANNGNSTSRRLD